MSSLLSTVTMAPCLMGLPATLGQHDVVLLPPLTPKHSRGVVVLATVLQQQPLSQMPLQAYANYAMCPLQAGFSFRVESPTVLYFSLFGVFWCMLSAFRCHAGCCIHLWGWTIGVCTIVALWSLPIKGICATWWWSLGHTRYAQNGCSFHCFE